MVVHVSLTTVTKLHAVIPASCSYLIEVTLVTCEKSVVWFDSTKHRKFSPGTLVSTCSNTGLVRDDPCWTSRENNLGS